MAHKDKLPSRIIEPEWTNYQWCVKKSDHRMEEPYRCVEFRDDVALLETGVFSKMHAEVHRLQELAPAVKLRVRPALTPGAQWQEIIMRAGQRVMFNPRQKKAFVLEPNDYYQNYRTLGPFELRTLGVSAKTLSPPIQFFARLMQAKESSGYPHQLPEHYDKEQLEREVLASAVQVMTAPNARVRLEHAIDLAVYAAELRVKESLS